MKNKEFFEKLYESAEKFSDTYNEHRKPFFKKMVASFGIKELTLFDISAMNILFQLGKQQFYKLAGFFPFKLPNMVRLLNKLESLYLTERFSENDNKRAIYVRLTPMAYDKIKIATKEFLVWYEDTLLKTYSKDELKIIANAVSFIIDMHEKIKILAKRNPSPLSAHEEFWQNTSYYRFYNNYFYANAPYEKPQLLKKARLSYAQMYVFDKFIKGGIPLSLSSFAEYNLLMPCQTTRLVNKLEAVNFVKRFKKSDDHRTVYIEPTETGKEVLSLAWNSYLSWLSSSLGSVLSDEQLDCMLNHYNFLIEMFKRFSA
ncbi:MAG: hypothetical protein FWE22_07555 [Firmicutes bacterium]|nr:hypothetical protein [Bacillota bacterium]